MTAHLDLQHVDDAPRRDDATVRQDDRAQHISGPVQQRDLVKASLLRLGGDSKSA
jgi:hypothetical protein